MLARAFYVFIPLVGLPALAAPLSPDAVDDAMAAAERAVQECYATARQRRPRIAGEVVVQATVGPTGAISAAKVARTSIADGDLIGCVLNAVQSQTIDRPLGGGFTPMKHAFLLWTPSDDAPALTDKQAKRLVKRSLRPLSSCAQRLSQRPDRLTVDLLVSGGRVHPVTADMPDQWARCAYQGFVGLSSGGTGVLSVVIRIDDLGNAIADGVTLAGRELPPSQANGGSSTR